MAYTQPRTSEDRGVSLYLLRWFRSAAVVVLVLLSTGVIAHGQTLAFRNPRDLLVDEPAAFIELLEAARPASVSMEDMGAILRALPPEGEITKLAAPAQQKVDAVRQLLKSTRREWFEIKVIDLPQAAVGLHARAVVLISAPAIAVLSTAELQALAAHEIGHEYVWTEWNRAHQHAERDRLKELELVCDSIAAVTLHQLGMDPSSVIDAIEKVTRFNRQRFGAATNENNYPTLAKRRAFARDIQQWLRKSSRRFALDLPPPPQRDTRATPPCGAHPEPSRRAPRGSCARENGKGAESDPGQNPRQTRNCSVQLWNAPFRRERGTPVNKSSVLLTAGTVVFATGLAAAGRQAPRFNPHLEVARGFLAFLDPNPAGLLGNGRSCADCHMPTDRFQLSPASVEARFQRLQQMRQDNPAADDPLFRPIDADDFRLNGETASDYTTLRENGLVRITFPLPPNMRLIDPLTNLPSDETFVDVWRSVPTINDVALTGPNSDNPWMREPNRFGGYQLDARVGTLQEQAVGALVNHAQVQSAPPQRLLDDLAAFQRAQFTSPRARALADAIAEGAALLPDPDLPLDPLEQEGKAVFQRACAVCHGGPSETTSLGAVVRFHDILAQCPRPVDPQGRFAFAACSPSLARNARTYEITIGTTKVRRTSSDPGRALLTGFVGGPAPRDDWNKFDVPSLRGIAGTAPYFHNNSAATLEEVVDHYVEFFKRAEAVTVPGAPIPPVATTDGIHFDRRPTAEERVALIAYLKRK